MSILSFAVLLVVSSCFQPYAYSTVVKKCPSLPCVRLFHSKGSVGCRAMDRHPNSLLLYMVEVKEDAVTEDDLMEALESIQEPVALVLRDVILGDKSLMRAVLLSDTVQALVLIPNGEDGVVDKPGLRHSPDVESPQGEVAPSEAFDTDPDYKWNVGGSGILEKEISIPVVFLQEKQAADDVKEYAIANRKRGIGNYPCHMANFDFYFGGEGVTSKSCLGWLDLDGNWNPKCAPLGGQSAWGTAGSIDKHHPVVMVTAGMDSKSMFHGAVPGTNSAVSSLVALLVAADSLASAVDAKNISLDTLPCKIAFSAFQGESWGFIGSRRFVKDAFSTNDNIVFCANPVESSHSPTGSPMCLDPFYPSLEFLNLSSPEIVLSVDQVGKVTESNTMFLHPTAQSSQAEDMETALALGQDIPILEIKQAKGDAMPPTPLTSFLKRNSSIRGMVLSGYDSSFVDPFYHSHWEDEIDVDAVDATGIWLARAAYVFAGGDKETSILNIHVNSTLVMNMVHCFTSGWDCSLVSTFVKQEVRNLAGYLNDEVKVTVPIGGPNMYTGPLEYSINGGLPLIRKYSKNGQMGSWKMFARSVTPWNPERHAISLSPSYLEMFVRAFLSEKLSIASGAEPRNDSHKCISNTDCSSKSCNSVRMECVAGACRCSWAHYHIAMDVGLIRQETPGTFHVVDDDQPLWAEPIWDSIGMFVYLDHGSSIGYVETSKVLICGSRPGMRLYDIVHNRILDCNFFSSEEKDAVKIVFSVVLQLRETLANLPSIHQTCAEELEIQL